MVFSLQELMRKAIGAFNMLKNGSEPSTVLNIFSTLQINTEDGLTRIVNLVVDTVSNMVQILQSCQGFLMSQSERMGSGRGGGQSPPKAEDSIVILKNSSEQN